MIKSQPCSDLVGFADGELDAERAGAFRQHLDECAACQADLLEAVQLGAQLSTLEELPRGGAASTEVRRGPASAAELRNAPARPPRDHGRSGPRERAARRSFAVGSGVGAAAVAVVAIATFHVRAPTIAGDLRPALTADSAAPVAAGDADEPGPSAAARSAFAALASRPGAERFAYAPAAHYLPTADVPRGAGGGANDRIPYMVLGELEQRGDRHALALARVWNGEPAGDAAAQLAGLRGPAARTDRAALAMLGGLGEPQDAVLAELDALAGQPDAAVARAATWNRALLLVRLGLPYSAAEAFDAIAAGDEPGWAGEARARAGQQHRLATAPWQGWDAALRAGRELAAHGALPPADLVARFPSLRAALYDAVRAAPSPERVRALAPLADQLDRFAGAAILGDYVRRVAAADFRRRAPYAAAYARLLQRASDAADPPRLTAQAPAADVEDIVLGALSVLGVAPAHLDTYRRLAERSGDPWFAQLAAQYEADAARARGDWSAAETQLRDALARCTRGVAYRCLTLRLALGQLYQDRNRIPEAIAVLQGGVRDARDAGEFDRYRALLYRLADVERFHGSIAIARARAEELVIVDRSPGSEGPYGAQAQMILAGIAIHELHGPAARRALDAAVAAGVPPGLATANALADIGRLDRHADDLARLQGWLEPVRRSAAATPAERVLADEVEGRLLIETDRPAGTARLESAIAAAASLARDVGAMQARAGAYSVLALDAARHGDPTRMLALTAAWLDLPLPGTCSVALVAEDERAAVAVRDGDGRDRGAYDTRNHLQGGAGTVPKELLGGLAACAEVSVLSPASGQGQPRVLPPEIAWSYATGAHARATAPPIRRMAPVPPLRVIVTDIVPPPHLQLAELSPWVSDVVPQATVLSGSAATPGRVLDRIRDASEIQFHTHALVDAGISDTSQLVLSAGLDGQYALTAEQIRSVELRGDPIVVLAACHSAQAARYQNTAWSLPDAFLAAGARAVLAAGSDVPDRDAGLVFARILDRVRAGVAPARALRDERVRTRAVDRSSWIADILVFE